MDNNYRLQILKENYKQNEGDESFKDWVEVEADSDPKFFNWFFGSDAENIQDYGIGMTPDQEEEYKQFLQSILKQ